MYQEHYIRRSMGCQIDQTECPTCKELELKDIKYEITTPKFQPQTWQVWEGPGIVYYTSELAKMMEEISANPR